MGNNWKTNKENANKLRKTLKCGKKQWYYLKQKQNVKNVQLLIGLDILALDYLSHFFLIDSQKSKLMKYL